MGVRLVGASDGFDIANPQATLLLPISSSYHAAFSQDLRAKVRRGIDDAFLRGENIQPPGLGCRMVTVRNLSGNDGYTRKDTAKLEHAAHEPLISSVMVVEVPSAVLPFVAGQRGMAGSRLRDSGG